MHNDFTVTKSKFRKPELEKMGWNIESLKKIRCLDNCMRELDLDSCVVKMFVGKREIE